jgi:hypothetical protein
LFQDQVQGKAGLTGDSKLRTGILEDGVSPLLAYHKGIDNIENNTIAVTDITRIDSSLATVIYVVQWGSLQELKCNHYLAFILSIR